MLFMITHLHCVIFSIKRTFPDYTCLNYIQNHSYKAQSAVSHRQEQILQHVSGRIDPIETEFLKKQQGHQQHPFSFLCFRRKSLFRDCNCDFRTGCLKRKRNPLCHRKQGHLQILPRVSGRGSGGEPQIQERLQKHQLVLCLDASSNLRSKYVGGLQGCYSGGKYLTHTRHQTRRAYLSPYRLWRP